MQSWHAMRTGAQQIMDSMNVKVRLLKTERPEEREWRRRRSGCRSWANLVLTVTPYHLIKGYSALTQGREGKTVCTGNANRVHVRDWPGEPGVSLVLH
jgi:hypothetical protein